MAVTSAKGRLRARAQAMHPDPVQRSGHPQIGLTAVVADNDVDEFGRFGPRYEHVGGDGEVESVECGAPEDVLHGLVAQQPVDGFADFRLYESADRLVGLDGYVDRSPSFEPERISLTSARASPSE